MKILIGFSAFLVVLSLSSCSENNSDVELIPFYSEGKKGYIDKNGETVIEPQFSSANLFSEGLALVRTDSGYGYIDKRGEFVIKPDFKHALPFSNGLAGVVVENMVPSYINHKGKIQIEVADAKWARSFFEDRAAVLINDKWGFIDRSGNIIIDPQFVEVAYFSNGLCAVIIDENERLWAYIDKQGEIVINPQFKTASAFSEDVASVSTDGQVYGYINTEGSIEINMEFTECKDFRNGLAVVRTGSKYGLINKKGEYQVNPKFDYLYPARDEPIFAFRLGENWGYANSKGKYVIDPQFFEASVFFDGIALFQIESSSDSNFGIIDKKGKILKNPQFSFNRYDESYMFNQFNDNILSDYPVSKTESILTDYFDPTPFIIDLVNHPDILDLKDLASNVYAVDRRYSIYTIYTKDIHNESIEILPYIEDTERIIHDGVELISLRLVFDDELMRNVRIDTRTNLGGRYRTVERPNPNAEVIGKKIQLALQQMGLGKGELMVDSLAKVFSEHYKFDDIVQNRKNNRVFLTSDRSLLTVTISESKNYLNIEIYRDYK